MNVEPLLQKIRHEQIVSTMTNAHILWARSVYQGVIVVRTFGYDRPHPKQLPGIMARAMLDSILTPGEQD